INVGPDHDLPCPSTAAAADGFHATTSSTTAALDDLFQRAQQDHPRLSSISRDEFQTTLWAALDANPDLVTPCLAQTFPQTKYLDWLMEDLSEWTPDDATVSAQHARWISFQLMSNSTKFSAPLWHEFRTANLVTILHLLLSQGAMGRLQILWRRHVCLELVDAFSVQSLPLDVPAATVTHWIRHEVLPVHQYFNVPVDKLALGIVERAKVMATEGDIEGALLWTTVVCPQLLPPERLWKQSKAHEHDPARQVHIQLQQLVYLASVPGLAMAMLDRVQVADMLPMELTNHVEPFLAITSKSALDDVLVDYVMEKAAEIPVLAAPLKWTVAVEVVQFGLLYLDTIPHMGQALLSFVSSLLAQSPSHRGFERVVNTTLQLALRQVHQLRTLYDVPLSMEAFQARSQHPQILLPLLQPWLDALRHQPAPSLKRKRHIPTVAVVVSRHMTIEGTNALTRTQQCSLLLGMPTGEFRAFLGVQAASIGDVDQALRFARNTNATAMKQVAVALLKYMVVSSQISHRRLRLARDLLVNCVTHESCTTTMDQDVTLLKQVALLCSIHDHTTDQSDARDELFQTYLPWRIYEHWYREAAVTLKPSVLPLAMTYAMSQQHATTESIALSAKQLISYLVDVQAPQLALSVLLSAPVIPDDAIEVPYLFAFRSDRRDHKAIQDVVPLLLDATSLDLYCALEFTRQYNIPDSVPCLLYVKALLLTSTDYKSQIVGVLEDVHEHELIPLLLSVLPKLSGTDYDRLLFVFNLLQKSAYTEQDEVQNRVQVLHFLQHYTPQLCFHAIMSDPWSVLASQLTATTVGQLVSLCTPLDIDADEMYMRLIKNMIQGDPSSLSFDSFRGILSKFSQVDHKITTAEWLSKKIPRSSFAISAVQFALDMSQQPSHPKTQRLQQTLVQLQTTECWNAMSQEFDGAALPEPQDSPKKLIELVYFKYGQQAWTTQTSVVHDAALKIATLNDADLATIQHEIRWKWLSARHTKPPTQQTVWNYLTDDDEDARLGRLLYISWTGDPNVLHELVKYACDPVPRAGLTYRVKYRALQIVQQIADTFQLETETLIPDSMAVPLSELKQSCRLLVMFEELQHPHSLASFVKSDKESLVRGLWREHYHDPAVVILISELMVSYAIANDSLWHRVLQQMVSLAMFPTLFHLLRPLIRQFPSVDLKPFFEQTIRWPLQHMDKGIVPANVECILEEIVFLIQQCPFIQSLNVVDIVQLLHTMSTQFEMFSQYAVQSAFGIPQVAARTALLCHLCDTNHAYVVPIFEYLANLSPLDVVDADFFASYIVSHPQAQQTLVQSVGGQRYCEWIARRPDTSAMDHALAFLYVFFKGFILTGACLNDDVVVAGWNTADSTTRTT
ncbi:hypothetical protein DYB26_005456, partial [Aphanomyces astaci]